MSVLELSTVYCAVSSGTYPVREIEAEQKTFLALTLGTSKVLNRQIIELGLERANGQRLWTDENGEGLVAVGSGQIEVVKGTISNKPLGKRPGTIGIVKALLPANAAAERPVLEVVTHANLAGRVALQALIVGWNPALPAGMPDWFDPESQQPWTRSRPKWAAYEWPYLSYTIARHQIQIQKLRKQGLLSC